MRAQCVSFLTNNVVVLSGSFFVYKPLWYMLGEASERTLSRETLSTYLRLWFWDSTQPIIQPEKFFGSLEILWPSWSSELGRLLLIIFNFKNESQFYKEFELFLCNKTWFWSIKVKRQSSWYTEACFLNEDQSVSTCPPKRWLSMHHKRFWSTSRSGSSRLP